MASRRASHTTKDSGSSKAAPKGAAAKLRANIDSAEEFEELEPLMESSANRDIAGVVIAVIAIASFIAVISPSSAPVTSFVAGFYHLGFGLGAYVLPLVILLFAATLFLGDRSPLNIRSLSGGALIFVAVVSLLSLLAPGTSITTDAMFSPETLSATGGYIGASIAAALQGAFGKTISAVILVGLIVVGLIVIGFSVSEFLEGAAEHAHNFVERRHVDVNDAPWGDNDALSVPAAPHRIKQRPIGPRSRFFGGAAAEDSADDRAKTRVITEDDPEDEDPFVDLSDQLEAEQAKTTVLPPKTTVLKPRHRKAAAVPEPEPVDGLLEEDDEEKPPFTIDEQKVTQPIPPFLLKQDKDNAQAENKQPVSLDKNPDAPSDDMGPAMTAEEASAAEGGEEGLTLPPLSMLHSNPKSASAASSDTELEQTAEALQNTLVEFGRTARVVGWISGPTVTTFKLQPGEGERVSKISSLEDDIALSLAAQSVRIFAPIPGTSLVGIEIPNRTRQNVFLGDVLPYVKGGPLELAIGRDAEGTPIVADLAKMPHLLIAGTTGSGKSVMINSIITTLLMRARPDDVRLIMVDPKRVELAGYNGLPHLYVPVVTEPKQAASALQWAVSEMERRLKVFEKLNVRKISTYNEKQAAGEFEHYDNPPQKMPYLVIIIDELSDLMMVAGKDVEASIVRIAQLGRAAGIHLIVATQRPSSNVVTGLIKANITNRIAFNVATGIDSRVIIDQMGAEKLTGLGDMLFSKVDWGKPRRIQGCFVSDDEINEIVEFVRSQSEPDYHEEILSAVSPATVAAAGAGPLRTGVAEPEDDDPLMWEAAKIVVDTQLGSTSGLQRRLKVGYARAGRIMDMLEEKGVVGPPDGSKPREVLLDEEGLEALKEVDAQMAREDQEFGGF